MTEDESTEEPHEPPEADLTDASAGQEPETPGSPGTILIPAGERILPEHLRPPEQEPQDSEADGEEPQEDSPNISDEVPRAPTSHPDLAAAIAAATGDRTSFPPVRRASDPALMASVPPQQMVDIEARREQIESRRRNRGAFIVIGLLLLAAVLAGAAIVIVNSQRADSKEQTLEQVLASHAVALEAISEANEPVVRVLEELSTEERPDLGRLSSVADEARAEFDGLVVPVPEGEFVELARNLQNAVDAELTFLDKLEATSAVALADAQESDVDAISRAWQNAATAIRTSYANQPRLAVPDLTAMDDALASFGSNLVTAADAARARSARLAELEAYNAQITQALADLERLRDALGDAEPSARRIETSFDFTNTVALLENAAEGRWALADRVRSFQAPSEFANLQADLADAIEALGDVVIGLVDAVYEADCTYTYFDTECPTIGETSSYDSFVAASDFAGDRLDGVKASFFTTYAQLSESLR